MKRDPAAVSGDEGAENRRRHDHGQWKRPGRNHHSFGRQRASDGPRAEKEIGIDLDREFNELYRDIPITYDHKDKWQEASKRLFDICEEMELAPKQLPKFGDYSRCTGCGRCVLGCSYGVKWDCRRFGGRPGTRSQKSLQAAK